MYLGREKYLFINLNTNQLTMIIMTSHRSSILILVLVTFLVSGF